MQNEPRLILASASPRRRELLGLLLPHFAVIPSGVDEGALIDALGEVSAQEMVQELARAKALDIARANRDAVVIGADTVVVVDGKILGKPADTDDASAMLTLLSGRTHEVYTGFAVVSESNEEIGADRTIVQFRNLTQSEIADYIATGEPMDKAGAYGIQDRGISPVASIVGDYFNVMGLPLAKLHPLLNQYLQAINSAPDPPVL